MRTGPDDTSRSGHVLPPGRDLVTDAELAAASDDEFQAAHLVAEIASVIESHEPGKPANIALYGPWGSGKSSIARLLENEYDLDHRQQLRAVDRGIKTTFIRFDAFKYAGQSLHRNFLLKVGEEFGKKEIVKDRLYNSRTARHVRLGPREALAAVSRIAMVVVVPTLIAAVVGAMAWAWMSERPFGSGFREVLPDTLALLALPAAAALFALMREILPSSVVTESPSSEEQFEEVFQGLVKDAKADRVVIFIDEIDRCAPSEVVETLDTIRTFLDVPKCVVIVAADQRVLEHALSEKVRQTTPEDTTNPYYSGGSAYLDKVFHYQFSIPSLLPAVVSSYALGLVRKKGGVWAAVDRENVISVLVPTHVRSPRRVKALLNNFVLTYRLALDRSVSATGARTLSDRATELAVLVCLRSEFPLFARELPQHPTLPALVRWLARNQPLSEKQEGSVDGEVELSDTGPEPRATASAWEAARRYHQMKALAEVPLSSVDVEYRPSDLSPPVGVVRAIRDDLVGYLSKTAYVVSPATDLIYLIDSSGFFGLEADTAEELASLAHNAERRELDRAVRTLDSDAQVAALQFLSHRTREYAVGEDGSNMASSLLSVANVVPEHVLQKAVNNVARAVEQQQKRNRLRRMDLSGALIVGLRSTWEGAAGLVHAVMESDAYESDSDLALSIVEHAPELKALHADGVHHAIGWALVLDSDRFQATLLGLSADVSAALMRSAASAIGTVVDSVVQASDPPPPDVAELQPDAARASAEAALVQFLHEKDHRVAEHLAVALLGEDGLAVTADMVAVNLGEFGFAQTEEFALGGLTAATNRPLHELAGWVAIATTDVCPIAERYRAADDLVRRLWAERAQAASEEDAFAEALRAVDTLAPGAADRRGDLTEELITDEFDEDAPDAANVNRLRAECEHVKRFVDAGLLHAPSAGNVVASALAAALGKQIPGPRPGRPTPAPDGQRAWIEEWAPWTCESADNSYVEPLLGAVMTSSWLAAPLRELVAVRVAAKAHLDAPYDTTHMVALAQEHAASTTLGLAIETWLTSFAVEPSDIWAIATPHLGGDLPASLREAIAAWTKRASKPDRTGAIIPALGVLPADLPHPGYLDALDASSADHRRVADEIARLCEDTRRWNPDLRANVLLTWRRLAVEDEKARTTLFRQIAVRFVNSGHRAALELLDFEDLLQHPPQDVREELSAAFRSTVRGKAREHAVRKMLEKTGIERLGLAEKAAGWLGLGR